MACVIFPEGETWMNQTTRRKALGWWLGFSSMAWLLGSGAVALAAPGVGDPAPDFSLMGSNGRLHSLSEHRGRKGVILAWFPKAFTPG
jgi:peroxiredoxin Q/BCP